MSLGAQWLTGVIPFAALAIGVALVAAGIGLLAGRPLGLRLSGRPRLSAAPTGYRSTFVFGAGYGLASLSCTLPIFLVVVGGSIPAGPLAGALMFTVYAAGMGTILTALAVAAAFSRTGLQATIRRMFPYVERFSAVLLIAAGVYIAYYWAVALVGTPEQAGGAAQPIEAGSRLASLAQAWLGSAAGRTVTGLLALGLAVVVVSVLAVRFGPGRYRREDELVEGTRTDRGQSPGSAGQRDPRGRVVHMEE